jgi:hypothetical protein
MNDVNTLYRLYRNLSCSITGWVEYHINRQRKHTDANTLSLFLTNDDGDPQTATLHGTQPNSDPIKAVAVCEFKLSGEEIVGMDLNGDVVLKK